MAELLIRGFKGKWSAIKFSKTDFYTSVKEITPPLEDGKDTTRLSLAGGSPVIWVKSPSEQLEEPLRLALSLTGDVEGVVVEGNSPIEFLSPDVVIFVFGKDIKRIKPSGRRALKRADLLIARTPIPEEILSEKRGVVTVVGSDFTKIAPLLVEKVEGLLRNKLEGERGGNKGGRREAE
ncbi:MAG: hypothetical protein D6726_12460 [Nitrospirae bacterium]|nr:MAG: hypothetical protein D6726_12460 [Nitrospirota bacterium]